MLELGLALAFSSRKNYEWPLQSYRNRAFWKLNHGILDIPYYPSKGGQLQPIISWPKMHAIELGFFSPNREYWEKFLGLSRAKSLKKTNPSYWIYQFQVFKNSDLCSSWGFSMIDLILGFFKKFKFLLILGFLQYIAEWKFVCRKTLRWAQIRILKTRNW